MSTTFHLRIVSDELFVAVERRFETTKKLWGVGSSGLARGQQKQVYLFSGLLQCGECGGSVTLVGGRANTSRSEYGCSRHAQRGDAVCKNDLQIQRKQLEESLLTGLQDKVLREEFIDYVICGLKEELKQKHEGLESWKKTLQVEAERIELELKHLVEVIAAGNSSPTVMAAISEHEARLREIRDQAIKPGPGPFRQKRTDGDKSGLRRTVSDVYGPKGIIPDRCGQCRTGGEIASELQSGIFGDLLGIGT